MKIHVAYISDYTGFSILATFDDAHKHLAQQLADNVQNAQTTEMETQDNIEEFKITRVHVPKHGEPAVTLEFSEYAPYPTTGYDGYQQKQTLRYTLQGHDPETALAQALAAREIILAHNAWPQPGQDNVVDEHRTAYNLINIQKAHLNPNLPEPHQMPATSTDPNSTQATPPEEKAT